ncbi:MAG: hypothetical protein M3Y72_19665 [Acidobacteriota bacterium]|nr:hypothetical protein [Acidobacteriota bacterium]
MTQEPQPASAELNRGRKFFILIATWVAAAVAILPVIFQWQPGPPVTGHGAHLQLDASYLCAFAICFWIYRVEVRRLSRPRTLVLVFLIFLLTSLSNDIHHFYIDQASYPAGMSHLAWQIEAQHLVTELYPAIAPHSYRFLPNAMVRWLELLRVGFEPARDIYRLIVGLILFYAIYRYARLFTNYGGALIALLLSALIYPISFEFYFGQLTDPLSHLSFVLAFIFLETGDFAFLLTTILLGSLAKETVLAMAGYYVLFCRKDSHYPAKSVTLCLSSLATYFGVRFWVLHGALQYKQVSGVTPAHAWENWHGGRWLAVFCLSVGALAPFLIPAWKQTPAALKHQVLFLLPVLFISGLFFSWLAETRNFMPLVFVLAVIAGNYLQSLIAETRPPP